MNFLDFLAGPVIKNRPIRHGIILSLILIVGVLLFATSVRSEFVPAPDSDEPVIMEPEPDNNEPDPEPDDDEDYPEPEPLPEREPRPDLELDSFSPLTGLPMNEAIAKHRPLAIVLSNVPEAMPMNGVSEADILYEYLVEGGITRMLAIYQDFYYVKLAGSIRSARHYTVEIAESYDAILLCAGRSPLAATEMRNRDVPVLNEVEGPNREVFWRNRNRVGGQRYSSLHAVVTSGERVTHWLPTYNFRTEHKNDYEHGLVFTDDGTPSGGSRAEEVTVRFSAGKTTSFAYNSTSGVYTVRQFNRNFVDGNDNSSPEFTNVIVMKTSVTALAGDDSDRRDIKTTGSGEGYYINGGRYVEIEWHRHDKSDPFMYTLKDGTELELGRGKTFIAIIPTNMSATFS